MAQVAALLSVVWQWRIAHYFCHHFGTSVGDAVCCSGGWLTMMLVSNISYFCRYFRPPPPSKCSDQRTYLTKDVWSTQLPGGLPLSGLLQPFCGPLQPFLSKPQLNDNLTSTVVGGWTWKWLCTPPHPTPPTHPTPHKLNIGNISAVTDPILTKL